MTQPGLDDRIAALIDERVQMQVKYPEHTYDTPEHRVSIAVSVAIGSAANPITNGTAYSGLINTWHNWQSGITPASSAAFLREHFGWQTEKAAALADAVADHIEASAADLLDDGATVAAWRAYATALRAPETATNQDPGSGS